MPCFRQFGVQRESPGRRVCPECVWISRTIYEQYLCLASVGKNKVLRETNRVTAKDWPETLQDRNGHVQEVRGIQSLDIRQV